VRAAALASIGLVAACVTFSPAASNDAGTEAGAPIGRGCRDITDPLLCDAFDRDRTDDVAGSRWSLDRGAGTAALDGTAPYSPARSLSLRFGAGDQGWGIGLNTSFRFGRDRARVACAVRVSGPVVYAELFDFIADAQFYAVAVDGNMLVLDYPDASAGTGRRYERTSVPVVADRWMLLEIDVQIGPQGRVELRADGVVAHARNAQTSAVAGADNLIVKLRPSFANVALEQSLTLSYDDISVR
jgi:hypothetical protein